MSGYSVPLHFQLQWVSCTSARATFYNSNILKCRSLPCSAFFFCRWVQASASIHKVESCGPSQIHVGKMTVPVAKLPAIEDPRKAYNIYSTSRVASWFKYTQAQLTTLLAELKHSNNQSLCKEFSITGSNFRTSDS